MANTKLDARQSVLRAILGFVGNAANEDLATLLPRVDAELAKLYEDRNIFLTDGGTVTFTGTQVQFTENLNLVLNQKISGAAPQIISLGSANVNFTTNGHMMYAVVNRTAGTATITSGATSLPAVTSANQEVFLIAKRIDAGDGTQRLYFRNGSAFNAGQSARLGSAGTGNGGGGTRLPASGYQAMKYDDFDLVTDSKVDTTKTNGTKSITNTLYALSCDKTRTVATSSGTAFTINLAPGFTVVAGDIVYLTSGARSGQWRRIASVTNQTTFVLDIAWTGGNASAADTLMISQAVWTTDLINDGDSSQKTRPRDFFPSTSITSINVDYHDSLTSGDGTPDFVDTARLVCSASNSGIQSDTGTPTADTFATIFTRPAAPGQIADYALLSNATKERLFLVFFPNPSNGSVTTLANLCDYSVSFYAQASVLNGGYLQSAFCMSDSSGTAVNCSNPTVVSTKTRVALAFNFVPALNTGRTAGDLDVYLDGQVVPRFLAGTTTDAYYTEVSGTTNTIEFHTDLSGYARSIEIRRRQGTIDTSDANSGKISGFQDVILGTAAQVTAGIAQYSTWQSAHDALGATGGKIRVIATPSAGDLIVSKPNVQILGKGRVTELTGNLTISSGADYFSAIGIRISGNVTQSANAGVLNQVWIPSASTVTLSGLGSSFLYLEE